MVKVIVSETQPTFQAAAPSCSAKTPDFKTWHRHLPKAANISCAAFRYIYLFSQSEKCTFISFSFRMYGHVEGNSKDIQNGIWKDSDFYSFLIHLITTSGSYKLYQHVTAIYQQHKIQQWQLFTKRMMSINNRRTSKVTFNANKS